MADSQRRKGDTAVAVVNNADDASFAGAAVQVCQYRRWLPAPCHMHTLSRHVPTHTHPNTTRPHAAHHCKMYNISSGPVGPRAAIGP